MLCLVIEASAAGGELPDFTRQNPGSTIDLMAEPAAQGNDDDLSALVLVRGAPWQDIDGFVAELGRKQGPVTTLRRTPVESLWFGRATFHPSTFRTQGAKALQSLMGMMGPPWVHIEHGVVHIRARIKDPAKAEDLLQRAVESLRAAGQDPQVVVQEVAPKDHSVWEGLVQRGIGLSL